MPNNSFYYFLQSSVRFFQKVFAWIYGLAGPFYRFSPLPDFIDFILICVLIVGIVFLLFQAAPWEKR